VAGCFRCCGGSSFCIRYALVQALLLSLLLAVFAQLCCCQIWACCVPELDPAVQKAHS
jgi:hypothetical protein